MVFVFSRDGTGGMLSQVSAGKSFTAALSVPAVLNDFHYLHEGNPISVNVLHIPLAETIKELDNFIQKGEDL